MKEVAAKISCVVFCAILFLLPGKCNAETKVAIDLERPGVVAALAGARQVRVAQQVFALEYEAVVKPVWVTKLPRFEYDPTGCVAQALRQGLGDAIEDVWLADLNWDGVPELIVKNTHGGKTSELSIYSVSDEKLERIYYNADAWLCVFSKVTDADGRVWMCLAAVDHTFGSRYDTAALFRCEPGIGWDVWSVSWAAAAEFENPVAVRRHRDTIVRCNGYAVIDPGDLLYAEMLACPAEAYILDPQKPMHIDNSSIVAHIENSALDGLGLEFFDLAQPDAARDAAARLIAQWTALSASQPVSVGTVLDVLEGNIPEE